jgi:hypothetical protein
MELLILSLHRRFRINDSDQQEERLKSAKVAPSWQLIFVVSSQEQT